MLDGECKMFLDNDDDCVVVFETQTKSATQVPSPTTTNRRTTSSVKATEIIVLSDDEDIDIGEVFLSNINPRDGSVDNRNHRSGEVKVPLTKQDAVATRNAFLMQGEKSIRQDKEVAGPSKKQKTHDEPKTQKVVYVSDSDSDSVTNESELDCNLDVTPCPKVQQLPRYNMWTYTSRNVLMVYKDSFECTRRIPYFDDDTLKREPNFVKYIAEKANAAEQNPKKVGLQINRDFLVRIVKKLTEERTGILGPKGTDQSRLMAYESLGVQFDAKILDEMRRLPLPLLSYLEESCPPISIFKKIAKKSQELRIEFSKRNTLDYTELSQIHFDSPQELKRKYQDCILDNIKQRRGDSDALMSLSGNRDSGSLDRLLCRRCLTYNCILHADLPIPSGLLPMASTEGPSKGCGEDCELNNPVSQLSGKGRWTRAEIKLFHELADIFPNNFCTVAEFLLRKCNQVHRLGIEQGRPVQANSVQYVDDTEAESTKFKAGWVKRPEEEVFLSVYRPCIHPGTPCTQGNDCNCRVTNTYCEKFCLCDEKCFNKFFGCKCTGSCTQMQGREACPCLAAQRECDPDLCKGCGSDKLHFSEVRCKNTAIQCGRHKHLLLGISNIAGWGIFTKDAIRKNEFIYEYCGEIIPMDEAELRGMVYDKRCHTFLFDLDKEFVLDAARIGNKIRFANHSDKPNCVARNKMVNGDSRIGIFALKNIRQGQELFLDYGDVLKAHKEGDKSRSKWKPEDGNKVYNFARKFASPPSKTPNLETSSESDDDETSSSDA